MPITTPTTSGTTGTSAGTYQVTADIEITADFTIDGSDWIPIDNTVTLHSTPTTLVAKEAHPVTNN